jgi:hypothetical protein
MAGAWLGYGSWLAAYCQTKTTVLLLSGDDVGRALHKTLWRGLVTGTSMMMGNTLNRDKPWFLCCCS